MKKLYFDYAAATPMDPQVLAVMQTFYSEEFYNPSATYLAAKAVSEDVEKARQKIAHWLGCRSSEVIFAAGGTEANNLAIRGIMERHRGSKVIVSAIEHESVIHPAQLYNCSLVATKPDGLVRIDMLEKLIDGETVLVSVMLANNEIGTVQPIKQISQVIRKKLAERQKRGNLLPLYLHVDACQAGAYLDLHVSRLGVDMMTINGGKIYGPKQTAALYARAGIDLTPQIYGGGQEHGRRSGTENVAGVVGLATALDIVQSGKADETKRMAELQRAFLRQIKEVIPQAQINGSTSNRLPNNVHLTLPGYDNERLMMELDERGIMCAVGSACSASSEEPSHVLKAIGLSDEDARSSLRFTMGIHTTKDDVESAVQTLASLL